MLMSLILLSFFTILDAVTILPTTNDPFVTAQLTNDPRGLNTITNLNEWQIRQSAANELYDWGVKVLLDAEEYGFQTAVPDSKITIEIDGYCGRQQCDLFAGFGIGDNQYVTFATDLDNGFSTIGAGRGIFIFPGCNSGAIQSGDVSNLIANVSPRQLTLERLRNALAGGDRTNWHQLTPSFNGGSFPLKFEFTNNDIDGTFSVKFSSPTFPNGLQCTFNSAVQTGQDFTMYLTPDVGPGAEIFNIKSFNIIGNNTGFTETPSRLPSKSPTKSPSKSPSTLPSKSPSNSPTTKSPSKSPSKTPSQSPTLLSTIPPTSPTISPVETCNVTFECRIKQNDTDPEDLIEIDSIDGVIWFSGPPDPASYATDGFVVALTGRVEWANTSVPFGSIDEGLIGTLNDSRLWPQYDAIFSLTNDKGLTCSVEVTKTGRIYLRAWSFPLMYFRTNTKQFTYIEIVQLMIGQIRENVGRDLKITNYNITNGKTNQEDLDNLFYINLDGIVYVRADAVIPVPVTPPRTTQNGSSAHSIPIDIDIPYKKPDQVPDQTIVDFIGSLSVSSGIICILLFTALIIAINIMVMVYCIRKNSNHMYHLVKAEIDSDSEPE